MDKKKLSTGFRISAIWLAILSLFMCFGAGLGIKDSGMTSGISVFDYMFGKGDTFTELKEAGVSLHNAGLIIAFVLMLLAIIGLIALLIASSKQKLSPKAKIAMSVVIAVMLLVAAIMFFCTKAFMDKIEVAEPELFGILNDETKLGAGAVCAGLFGIFAAGSTLVGYLTKEN